MPVILIAEDEEVNYLYLEALLKKKLECNCHLIHVKNGLDAVNKIKSDNKIDIVLMDIKMPVMDGNTATQKVKKLKPQLPVIALTAYSSESDRKKAFSHGYDEFISKPVNAGLLINMIKKHINVNWKIQTNNFQAPAKMS